MAFENRTPPAAFDRIDYVGEDRRSVESMTVTPTPVVGRSIVVVQHLAAVGSGLEEDTASRVAGDRVADLGGPADGHDRSSRRPGCRSRRWAVPAGMPNPPSPPIVLEVIVADVRAGLPARSRRPELPTIKLAVA